MFNVDPRESQRKFDHAAKSLGDRPCSHVSGPKRRRDDDSPSQGPREGETMTLLQEDQGRNTLPRSLLCPNLTPRKNRKTPSMRVRRMILPLMTLRLVLLQVLCSHQVYVREVDCCRNMRYLTKSSSVVLISPCDTDFIYFCNTV